MINKKSKRADLENKRGMFFLIGLLIALSSVLFAFGWQSEPGEKIRFKTTDNVSEDFYIPPVTKEKTEPPKQIIELPVFELVDNSSDINFEMDVIDSDPASDIIIDFNDLILTENNKEEEPEEILLFVQEMPQFPGGEAALLKYLSNNIKYPVIAQENGIQGKVYVSFVIDKTGSISDVRLLRGVDKSLDYEALRVIKTMPKWRPGRQHGKAVKVRFTLPVLFKLQ